MHEIVCMGTSTEINALLNLIDDPDEEVFGAVSERIVDYGTTIIPTLEHWWETIPNEQVQGRIEGLIHRLQLRELKRCFTDWKEASRKRKLRYLREQKKKEKKLLLLNSGGKDL